MRFVLAGNDTDLLIAAGTQRVEALRARAYCGPVPRIAITRSGSLVMPYWSSTLS